MEFSKLGEIRCLILSHVRMMTLTATATKETTKKVIAAILGLQHPVIVSQTQCKLLGKESPK